MCPNILKVSQVSHILCLMDHNCKFGFLEAERFQASCPRGLKHYALKLHREWKRFLNEKLHNMYFSFNIFRVITSKRLRLAVQVPYGSQLQVRLLRGKKSPGFVYICTRMYMHAYIYIYIYIYI